MWGFSLSMKKHNPTKCGRADEDAYATRIAPSAQWCSHWGVKGGRVPPLTAKNLPKIRKKRGKKEDKSGRKGKNQEGSFTLPLLTERTGYATAPAPAAFFLHSVTPALYYQFTVYRSLSIWRWSMFNWHFVASCISLFSLLINKIFKQWESHIIQRASIRECTLMMAATHPWGKLGVQPAIFVSDFCFLCNAFRVCFKSNHRRNHNENFFFSIKKYVTYPGLCSILGVHTKFFQGH